MASSNTPVPPSRDPQAVAEEMHALEQRIKVCRACPLAQARTHAVPGEGDYSATVMFVGEGPGSEEDRQGRPFVGASGQFLTESLAQLGIRRTDVYITNVVKCRPPNNRDPLPNELNACSGYLDRQVELVNPRIIVTLGRYSMRRWFGDASITRIHGQIRNIGHGRVALAMFHPAAALRNPQWREDFARDLTKLPPLIQRAQAANAAVARGEALPAGAPHPGDPDYGPPTPHGDTGAAQADDDNGDLVQPSLL